MLPGQPGYIRDTESFQLTLSKWPMPLFHMYELDILRILLSSHSVCLISLIGSRSSIIIHIPIISRTRLSIFYVDTPIMSNLVLFSEFGQDVTEKVTPHDIG